MAHLVSHYIKIMDSEPELKPAKKAKKKVKPKASEIVVHNITRHAIHTGKGEKIEPGKCAAIPADMADLLLELKRVEIVQGVDS